jgi:hypothetical protein
MFVDVHAYTEEEKDTCGLCKGADAFPCVRNGAMRRGGGGGGGGFIRIHTIEGPE